MNKSLRPETRDKKCRGTSGIGKVHAVFDRLGVVTAYKEILAGEAASSNSFPFQY